MSRILVTGSRGTLGTRLVKELKNRGNFVYGIDLAHSNEENYQRCDIRNFRKLDEVWGRIGFFDYVYHLAAEFGRINGEENYEDLWTTNLIGTRNVAELCALYETKLIFASSSEIYGETEKFALDEKIPDRNPIRQKNDYALSKWANEVQLVNLAEKKDLQVEILRFFNAYGPGERYHPYRSVIALFCYSALNDIPYIVFDGYFRTFMHVEDFIPTLANVTYAFEAGEVINIGGTDYRSVKEVSDIALNYLDKSDELVTYLPQEKHNVVSKRPDILKAQTRLGHNPQITIDTGVPNTIEWMIEYYGMEQWLKKLNF
jgi:dTDP-glucose 4,6-dehydratase